MYILTHERNMVEKTRENFLNRYWSFSPAQPSTIPHRKTEVMEDGQQAQQKKVS